MDGSTIEHSDSDSGESWTLLEASPVYADEVPELHENAPEIIPAAGDASDFNCENDDDTDGISIISDSEPESPFPCEVSSHRYLFEEDHLSEQQKCPFIPTDHLTPDLDQHEPMKNENDLLGDTSGKHRTYVHRRNKRLSMVLNIIVLGSVITAAGVAIGHMWGAKNECSFQTTPSVNKILSNLYKLQEENAYLRSKLKELTLLNNIQMHQKKAASDKLASKQNKCKKVFEASLNNKNVEKYTKCVEVDDTPKIDSYLVQPEYEKEFLDDINKLKNVYEQNKSWLDEEITKRLNHEKQLINRNKHHVKAAVDKILRDNLEAPLETITELPNIETNVSELPQSDHINVLSQADPDLIDAHPVSKISYADSLQTNNKHKKIEKQNNDKHDDNEFKDRILKRKLKRSIDTISEQSLSEDEIKKDDRYTGHKYKLEKKKNDRQKSHKKQKRKNKYEQWEMKRGYMKDYDDFSMISQDPEAVYVNIDKNRLDENFDGDNASKLSGTQDSKKSSAGIDIGTEKILEKLVRGPNWYDNRAVLRMEARKKLQTELFGDVTPNTAGWYFRRMRRREQCRAKNDNSTHKKFLKRNMNFKTKH